MQGNSLCSKLASCPLTLADGRWLERPFQLAFVFAVVVFTFSSPGGPALNQCSYSFHSIFYINSGSVTSATWEEKEDG